MRKMESGEENRIHEYLLMEEPFTVYMLSDLDNYGLGTDNVEFFCQEVDGVIHVVLMRYFNSFVIYSQDNCFDREDVLHGLFSREQFFNSLSCITGKESSVAKISPINAIHRVTHILQKHNSNERADIYDIGGVEVLGIASSYKIAQHYQRIPEMVDKYGINLDESIRDINCNLESGRLFGMQIEDKIVASIMTTAETSSRAMLINVCTEPQFRGQGMCSKILRKVCGVLFAEGKSDLYIYYDNDKSGRIYKREGFRFYGDYGRISINEIIRVSIKRSRNESYDCWGERNHK